MDNIKSLRTPAVFVSSTCLDLKQIREDIKRFIEDDLKYHAILSEYDSFPLNPNQNTLENCLRNVKEQADIFVLIIGCRYGSVTKSGKSVTQLEYLTARSSGIPIYAFVSNETMSILPIWRSNPDGDFSSTVDNPRIFEFIEELRGKENIWVYSYESAKDIEHALKNQFGYLFQDALKIRSRIYGSNFNPKLAALDGEALKYILEKPVGWELKFMGRIMEEERLRLLTIKRDLIYGIWFGHIISLDKPEEVFHWIYSKTSEIISIADAIHSWIYNVIPDAVRKMGEDANQEMLIYAGENFGKIYDGILKWGLEFKVISVDIAWESVVHSISGLWKTLIDDLERFCDEFNQKIDRIEMLPLDDEGKPKFELELHLTAPDLTGYYREIKIAKKKFGIA